MADTNNRNTNLNTLTDAAALSNVEQPGYNIPTPGAPGLINIDHVNDNAGSKQGDIGHFGVTDDLTPTLQGTIEGGEDQVLRIYANGVQLGSTTVGADGSWSFTPDTLEGGSKYAFEVVLKDPLTDEILVASETYTIITTDSNGDNGDTASVPKVNGILDNVGEEQGPVFSGDTTDDSQPTVFGKADAGSVVVIYDNGQPIGSVTTNAKGNWTFTPNTPLADGEHSITAAELNADGNPGEQSPATDFIVDGADTTAPAAATDLVLADDVGSIKGDIHNGDSTDDAKPTLSGQAEAGATVIVSDNGKAIGSAVVGDNGKWTFTPGTNLADGNHSISTVVEDAAGNKSPASDAIGFIVDTGIEKPVITSAEDNVGLNTGEVLNQGTTDDTTPLLKGTAEAGSTVIISSGGEMPSGILGSTVADATGHWTFQVTEDNPLSLSASGGMIPVTALAVDAAGNAAASDGFYLKVVPLEPTLVSGSENFDNQYEGKMFTDLTFASGLTVTSEGADYARVISSAAVVTDPKDAGQKIYLDNHNGGISNQGGEGSLLFSLPGSAQSISFDYTVAQEVTVYDTQHNVITSFTPSDSTTIGDAVGDHWLNFEYTAPEGVEIGSFSVGGGYSWLDNVQWSDTGSTQWSQSAAINNEAYDLTNNTQNTLALSHADLLQNAQENLYINDGHKQAAIHGDAGDVVEIDVSDFNNETWSVIGSATAGGVQYDVYQHGSDNLELLVQHDVQLHQVV